MNTRELLGTHYLNEVQNPSKDSNMWLAYLCLREIYPRVSYWSYDGYHVDALIDYDRGILWEDDCVSSIDRKTRYLTVPPIYQLTTSQIITIWKRNFND